MSAGMGGKALRQSTYGLRVFRPAAVLPATTTQNIFLITGGRIIVTTLLGEFTTTASGTATNLKVTSVSTVGPVITDVCANTAIASMPTPNLFGVSGLSATAASIGSAVQQHNEFIVQAGNLRLITDGTNTAQMSWTLLYIPLDDGASVAVA